MQNIKSQECAVFGFHSGPNANLDLPSHGDADSLRGADSVFGACRSVCIAWGFGASRVHVCLWPFEVGNL